MEDVEKKHMKLYALSGLGADERVFECLELAYDLLPLKWTDLHRRESLAPCVRLDYPLHKP